MKVTYSEKFLEFWYSDKMEPARLHYSIGFILTIGGLILLFPGIGLLLFVATITKSVWLSSLLFSIYLFMFPGKIIRKCFKVEWRH